MSFTHSSNGIDKCIKCDDYYDFVERVNRKHMEEENFDVPNKN